MTKPIDYSRGGFIGCPPGAHAIVRSMSWKALSADGDDLELWHEGGDYPCAYFWIVSHAAGFPRRLALVRFNSNTNRVEERIEGAFGTESWIDVAWEER